MLDYTLLEKFGFPSGKEISAEKATTTEERVKGLMYREKLAENEGMLFIFENEDFHSIWMKNMLFSIDIIWLDKNKRIVYFTENAPPCNENECPSYVPLRKAKYVIEVKSGLINKEKIKLGDELKFELE